jgi:hypothetical protein
MGSPVIRASVGRVNCYVVRGHKPCNADRRFRTGACGLLLGPRLARNKQTTAISSSKRDPTRGPHDVVFRYV